eukprot:Platyproteum_vivax@DN5162_c0_g1_i2.p1
MVFRKEIVVDGKGHLMGRLASKIAKELLLGQKVVVVRCEEINISGSLFRNHLKYSSFMRKRTNSNPKKGPFHYRAPSRILLKCIRGMIPRRSTRGRAALERLTLADGVPAPHERKKKMVIPDALKAIKVRSQCYNMCS